MIDRVREGEEIFRFYLLSFYGILMIIDLDGCLSTKYLLRELNKKKTLKLPFFVANVPSCLPDCFRFVQFEEK